MTLFGNGRHAVYFKIMQRVPGPGIPIQDGVLLMVKVNVQPLPEQ